MLENNISRTVYDTEFTLHCSKRFIDYGKTRDDIHQIKTVKRKSCQNI
jgi:hypothetical protein